MKSARPRRRFGLVALAIVVLAIVLAVADRQGIYDWVRLHDYTPDAAISQLAADDTMTPYAQRVFYVNHPQLDNKASFAPQCPSGTEQSVVLGCYHPSQDGIWILAVSDSRLKGIEQVTSAHETLHALYGRLSAAKRQQVDTWLINYYHHGLTDPTIKQQIAEYQKTEPHDVVNEMHSVFGTEAANLPAALENYYRQYFTDRQALVGDYHYYEKALSQRVTEINHDDSQLQALKAQINSGQNGLAAAAAALDRRQAALDSERAADPGAYNAAVPSYNAQVAAYNSQLEAVRSLISRYNALVAARNKLALEQQQLVSEISGSSLPAAK